MSIQTVTPANACKNFNIAAHSPDIFFTSHPEPVEV